MDNTLDSLHLLAEVTTSFVAFAVIVASIRVTFGAKLEPFQKLLVHFFTESGMLTVTFALLAIVLYDFWPDELRVATITTWYAFLMIAAYLPWYIRRRRVINAPTPLISLVNIIFWITWVIVLGLTLTELFWLPSLAIISALTFWGLFSATIIFISFLGNFLGVAHEDDA
jgi:hypothetical protein